MGPKLEDIDDLMHNIQSRLPIKEAARTSVLSKSWLHAWSTIPTLRFNVLKGKQLKLIDMDRTLIRYLRDNIPIETFTLTIDIENQESASHVAKLIGPMASKPFLKEISLLIFLKGTSFMLPNEILASENLTKIKVSYPMLWNHSVWMTNTPVINCVSLRKLHLDGVCMSEEVLHDILSYCKLLEKISLLYCCKGFKTIRVKNLSRLYKLKISLDKDDDNGCFTTLDIVNVPNLDVFSFDVQVRRPDMPLIPFNAHSIGSNVTQLKLVGMITDIACLDKIKSGFPLLGCLTLGLESWKLESFHFTFSPSLKLIVLQSCPKTLTDVKIHAKNLRFFEFKGKELPTSLLFPVSTLKQTNFTLSPNLPIDVNFFVRMREALKLSREFYLRIKIKKSNVVPMDIDHLRTRLMFPPATNVQTLWFETIGDEGVWERSMFFDAFFEICHPKYVYTRPDVRFKHNNHFSRLMLKEVLDKNTNKTGTACWSHYLKHVRIRRTWNKKWKTLKESHRSLLDGSVPAVSMYFKLNWC